jgi:hypothetical protein
MHEGEEGVVTIDFTRIEWLFGGRKPAKWSGGRGLALLRV